MRFALFAGTTASKKISEDHEPALSISDDDEERFERQGSLEHAVRFELLVEAAALKKIAVPTPFTTDEVHLLTRQTRGSLCFVL